jgi:hypothetical protein
MTSRRAPTILFALSLGACVGHSTSTAASSAHSDTTRAVTRLERAAGPDELVVALRYHERKGFRFIQARWRVDGQPVSVMNQGGAGHDMEIFRHKVAPGTHTVAVVLSVAAPGHGAMVSRLGRSTPVEVRAGAGTCIVGEVIHSERDVAAGRGQSTFIIWRTDCQPEH